MRGRTVSIELPLKRGKVAKSIPLYQWDYGQKLVFTGATLPNYYEVHFAADMHGESVTMVGDSTGVMIPDDLLTTGDPVYLWLYLHEAEGDGETEFQGVIPVIRRAEPTDISPTPEEDNTIAQIIEALNGLKDEVEEQLELIEGYADVAESAVASAEAAQTAAEEAQASAESVKDSIDASVLAAQTAATAAETAQSYAESASTAASNSASSASSSAGTASSASTDATSAKNAAVSAKGDAESAANDAIAAASDAALAQTAAETAQGAAEDAQAAAELAQGAAETASTAAVAAQGAAETAQGKAEDAQAAAESAGSDAEAYAVGTRGGVDVDNSDPAYENNAKYYAESMAAVMENKADLVSDAVEGNFAALDSDGNLTDSGHKHSDYITSHQDISGKLDKPNVAGTSGQVLTSDGAGAQSWQTPTDPTSIIDDTAGVGDTNKTWSADKLLDEFADATAIDDTAGAGDTDVVWSADKCYSENSDLLSAINSKQDAPASGASAGKVLGLDSNLDPVWLTQSGGSATLNYVTPEDYGAVGDGTTDDSQAVQDAIDAGYAVYFASNKTYYLASTVTIDHDCHLFGGEGATIKTATPNSGTINGAFKCSGTLKKTTTLTSNYKKDGSTNNGNDRFKLTDMTDISIGDIMVITAEDQYYSYARSYYYLGGALLIADVTDDYLFACDSLPYDITNSNDVSVKIYDAPEVIIENLHFVSDLNSTGTYVYPLLLEHCKNSVVRNCDVSETDNGIRLTECVNTLLDIITISKMPEWGSGSQPDHYALAIYSSTNTSVSKLMGNTANSMIDMSGTIPNLNTRIMQCNLFATNRHSGFGMHENAYNTVLEDCVIGGMTGYGTMYVNRCRFVRSYRNPSNVAGIIYRGGHNQEWSSLSVSNCIFEDSSLSIEISSIVPQSPIQAFDQIIGEIHISDCYGGKLTFVPTLSSTILSNTIQSITVENWKNCYEFYHNSYGTIDRMIVSNCEFTRKLWLNDHSNNLASGGIRQLVYRSDNPAAWKTYIDVTKYGGKFYLPEGISIACSSQTQTDYYAVCGKNLATNKVDDLSVGSVSGSTGSAISRSVNSNFSSALSVNSDNEIVFTQPNNSTSVAIYSKCFVYVPNNHVIKMSCKLKNTGSTNGATFRPYIAVIDCKTGLITYRNNGTEAQATAQGATVTHSRDITDGDSLVLFYLYCSTAVANSKTTLSEYVAEVMDYDFDETLVYEEYMGSSRTGDGSITSIPGENNFMTSASSFEMKCKANYLRNDMVPSAVGVSF